MLSLEKQKRTEVEASVDIILSQYQQSRERISLFILDGNLLIDSEKGLRFLPLTIPTDISCRLFNMGILNFEITNCASSTIAASTEKFLALLCKKDEARIFNSETLRRDFSIRPVILSSPRVPQYIRTRSTKWQEECAKRFRDKKSIVISLHQPGYLRHLGFFVKMAQSDILGVEDSLQYCKQEWQNRQRFQWPDGMYRWLTVPIAHSSSNDPISEKRIAADPRWRRRHRNVLVQTFRNSSYFEEVFPFFEELYARNWFRLRSLCEATTRHLAIAMGLKGVNLIRTSALGTVQGKKGFAIVDFIRSLLPEEYQPHSGAKHIIYLAGADSAYLTQPSGDGQTIEEVILSSGISIQYQKRVCEPSFAERGFSHGTPAIEVLFREGIIGIQKLIRSEMGEKGS